MRPVTAVLFVLLFAACQSSRPVGTATPGHGAISIEVVPNPIVAKRVQGNTFEFPFDLVVKETGGHAVTITRVDVTVYTAGGLPVGHETWDAARLQSTGASTSIAPLSENRYHFSQRREIPDERLLNGVSAQMVVQGHDDEGIATTANTSVTVRR